LVKQQNENNHSNGIKSYIIIVTVNITVFTTIVNSCLFYSLGEHTHKCVTAARQHSLYHIHSASALHSVTYHNNQFCCTLYAVIGDTMISVDKTVV